MKNIGDVVINSDKHAKCNWFSYVYVAVMYALGAATLLYIAATAMSLSPLKRYIKIWQITAAVALGFTLVFYVTCQQPLPRKNVL